MKTPAMYRLQARETLNNHWTKSALSTLLFYFAILTPSVIVILCTDGFNAANTSPLWAWLAIFSGFGVVPFTFAYCVSYLNHIRVKEATFLKDIWSIGIKNYGRFLGAFMVMYIMSLIISGIISLASNIVERYNSLLAILIYILVVLWLFFLLLQIMYAYRLVPFLLYDTPQLKVIDALKQSNKMMKGHKLALFRLDFSLFQWYIYAFIITISMILLGEHISSYSILIIGGVIGIVAVLGTLLFLYPYICTTSAAFYEDLTAKSINEITDEETLPKECIEETTIEK
jgi:uncharacterized membrane protein